MSANGTVAVVLPATSDDELSDCLVWLTWQLDLAGVADGSGFGLGGEYGYGVTFENETFAMHRYCWCDGPDCPWCSYSDDEGRHFQERLRAYGAVPGIGSGAAPNFWHKPSGFKVWWYKWIGRSNETVGDPGDIRKMVEDCFASATLPPPPVGE